MELTKFLAIMAAVLPAAIAAPAMELDPKILEAMKRDLGLDAEQATARVNREVSAGEVIEALESATGASFAGAWVADEGATITVAVTDESLVAEVEAAGAKPVVVANSFSKLEALKDALDALVISEDAIEKRSNTEGVAAWFVDVEANIVVLEALADSVAAAEEFAAEAGLVEGEFEVRVVEDLPETTATIEGGIAYLIGGSSRCSVGFAVSGGFVTAGHCGRVGSSTTISGQSTGSFAGSIFPGSDMAWVRVSGSHTLRPYVNRYGASSLAVTGSSVAQIGASICRSGSTTGVYCGAVRQFGVTVNYAQGAVRGMTGTSVCAEPGDSGGSFYAGSQAQGVTSGGSGNCRTGGVTYFQPLNPILSQYGLSLLRA